MSKLYQAISEIQQPNVVKLPRTATGQVGTRNYKYLTIDTLHDAVFPLLKEKGLVWVTIPTETENGEPGLGYSLMCIETGEAVEGLMPILPPKADPQGLGAAITYARRYALLSVLGLVGEDDVDGAVGGPQRKSEGAQTQRSTVPRIPVDRAKAILEAAKEAGLADGMKLSPTLSAKLVDVGVQTGKLGHLNVDQAEAIEVFIANETMGAS